VKLTGKLICSDLITTHAAPERQDFFLGTILQKEDLKNERPTALYREEQGDL
jgi:hypothetical protein